MMLCISDEGADIGFSTRDTLPTRGAYLEASREDNKLDGSTPVVLYISARVWSYWKSVKKFLGLGSFWSGS